MREFDKWNTKQPRELPFSEERKHFSLIDAVRKQGWKAALEWVLKHVIYDPDGGYIAYEIIDGVDFIEEELNAKT